MRALAFALLLSACDETAPDGAGLVVEIRDQPATPDFGVLLAIHARGGDSILVSVESGTMTVAGSDGSSAVTAGCMLNIENASSFTTELAVVPDREAALVSATLYASDDCTKSGLQSRLVVVEKPSAVDAVDAGIEDAP